MYNLISAKENIMRAVYAYKYFGKPVDSKEALWEYMHQKLEVSLDIEASCHHSAYNYCVPHSGKNIVFNMMYDSLIVMDDTEYEAYLNPEKATKEEKQVFLKNGLWIADGLDEHYIYTNLVKVMHEHHRYQFSIVLTTTLKCNARCTYCYESGTPKKSFEINDIDKLVDFIKSKDLSRGLNIIWFGGEPLMNIPFIDALSDRLSDEGIDFHGYLITNGSLINEDIIKNKFHKWNVNELQITLDGPEGTYEKIKKYVSDKIGHFYDILGNIKLLANNGVNVNIRLNIDAKNGEQMIELVKTLDYVFGDNEKISLHPAFIAGSKQDMPESGRIDLIYNMIKVMRNPQRLISAGRMHEPPRISPCHRYNLNAYAIDAFGNIFTCEHQVGHEKHKIGDIFNDIKVDETRMYIPEQREECKNCIILPKCYGGCESNYLNGAIPCMVEKYTIPAYLKYLSEI